MWQTVDAPSLRHALDIENRTQVLCTSTGELAELIRRRSAITAPRNGSHCDRAPTPMNRRGEMSPIVNYENKVVVVTGAATGVGAALVEQLRAAGAARIIAFDIKRCRGPVDQTISVDLADPLAIDEAIEPAARSHRRAVQQRRGRRHLVRREIVMAVNVFAPKQTDRRPAASDAPR